MRRNLLHWTIEAIDPLYHIHLLGEQLLYGGIAALDGLVKIKTECTLETLPVFE